ASQLNLHSTSGDNENFGTLDDKALTLVSLVSGTVSVFLGSFILKGSVKGIIGTLITYFIGLTSLTTFYGFNGGDNYNQDTKSIAITLYIIAICVTLGIIFGRTTFRALQQMSIENTIIFLDVSLLIAEIFFLVTKIVLTTTDIAHIKNSVIINVAAFTNFTASFLASHHGKNVLYYSIYMGISLFFAIINSFI
ncbi:MAG: hypothetical protein OEY49_20165, partial [Candidatus Heimdallarchaeota archaeon]|nr:hypothetical protein [Candidatus Heimdallarchaeota archaeon]